MLKVIHPYKLFSKQQLGTVVGFCGQRLVPRDRDNLKGIYRIILTAIILSIGTIGIVGGINNYLEKGGGEVVA
ncbi:hypothetical protein BK133_22170 [Paenibacillus sp. FSL H8-0548]|nr:hypothetical protein BK133_22170 [Paenibacillus sp. FSL H8-0548]